MTGLELHDLLERSARNAGVALTRFVMPLANYPDTFLSQLKQAKNPKPRTIQRVTALLEGRPIPAGQGMPAGVVTCTRAQREARGLPPSQRMIRDDKSLSAVAKAKAWVEHTRYLTELAHQTRSPGQSVADRVRELRLDEREQTQGIVA
jgi:hypothetical protein